MRPPVLLYAVLLSASALQAGLVRLEIQERAPVLQGRSFGPAGAYERIKAKALFAIDPTVAANAGIVDLRYAPRNKDGLVEFSADVDILRPANPARGNHTLLFEPPNRGSRGILAMFDHAKAGDPVEPEQFGDGFLLQQGYTIVWVGWQTDVPPVLTHLRLYAPVAKGQKGLVRSEHTPDTATDLIPLGDANHKPFLVDRSSPVEVTVRDGPEGTRQALPASDWSLVDDRGGAIRLKSPATPGRIYEIVYTSSDPPIAALGAAAVRDTIEYLKRDDHQSAIAFGISQSAMFLRGFLYEGFNKGEQGHRIFDGVFAHVGGGRRTTFQRFVQMSRTAGPLRNGSLSTTEEFPYTDLDQRDPFTGRVDGILHRARAGDVVPKIFYTNSAYEYWGSGGSLIHTTPDGKHDVAPPPTTRIYFLAGGQHGPAAFPPSRGRGQNTPNFNDYRWAMRALLCDLQDWVTKAKEPPPSAYPRISDGTAVSLTDLHFPSIPDVRLPTRTHMPAALDFGPDFRKEGIASVEPPRVIGHYQPRVPQVGKDGNDIAGVRMPEIACPVASWTGWNLRSDAIGASDYLLTNTGSFIPLPASYTASFKTSADYAACVKREGNKLTERRLLLAPDVQAVVDAAVQHWNWMRPPQASSLN